MRTHLVFVCPLILTHPRMCVHACTRTHTHTHTHTHIVLYTRNLQYFTFFEALDGVANALDNVDASASVIVSCMYTIGCIVLMCIGCSEYWTIL